MKRSLYCLMFIVLSICFSTFSYSAADLTFGWDAPIITDDVVATNIYLSKTLGMYTEIAVVVPQPLNSGTILGVLDGTYYSVSKFIDKNGLESDFSLPVTVTVKTTRPTYPKNYKNTTVTISTRP